jgi:UDP-3-O-[3-hydroxymyristoyl] glucosamine N-acyltransferase
MTLEELARYIGADVMGDKSLDVTSVATLEDAKPGQLSFVANPKYAKQLETTRATAVVVGLNVSSTRVALLRTKDPYYAYSQAIVALHGYRKHAHQGVHAKANIEATATIGGGTVVYPGVYVGAHAKIGRDCILYPNVVVYENCTLGDRVTVHGGTVIGQDGFGYATHGGVHHKIPMVGNVVIEDDVEIGANCTIDRATLGSTFIGKGTKVGNLNNIAHNTRIGANGLLVGGIHIAGSVTIGQRAVIAGQVGIAGHLKIGDGVTIGAQAGVISDVPDQSTILGAPAMPASQARRVYSVFTQLPELLERIKRLEQAVGELDSREDQQTV